MLTQISKKRFVEGYFGKDYASVPTTSEDQVDENFIEKLQNLMDMIYENRYNLNLEKYKYKQYLGCSNCRICGKQNGSEEYEINFKGIWFLFPGGVLHYYKEHNVQPSKKFMEAVMNI